MGKHVCASPISDSRPQTCCSHGGHTAQANQVSPIQATHQEDQESRAWTKTIGRVASIWATARNASHRHAMTPSASTSRRGPCHTTPDGWATDSIGEGRWTVAAALANSLGTLGGSASHMDAGGRFDPMGRCGRQKGNVDKCPPMLPCRSKTVQPSS